MPAGPVAAVRPLLQEAVRGAAAMPFFALFRTLSAPLADLLTLPKNELVFFAVFLFTLLSTLGPVPQPP